MECKKEEAERAKAIAEAKMLEKDFTSAREIMLKARNLFPGLENASQMLTVCQVHCAAEAKLCGEMDWYGILQVPLNANNLTINGQYRKLALFLHPDKNKFAGAEEAFKLVEEARTTLTNDIKSTRLRSVSSTFLTRCTHCKMELLYYTKMRDTTIICLYCKISFVAHDLCSQATHSAVRSNHSEYFGAKSNIYEHGNLSKAKMKAQTKEKRVREEVIIISDDDDLESQNSKKPRTVNLDKDKEDTEKSSRDKLYVYPNSVFHKFEDQRMPNKLKKGQTWALYCELTKNPNLYGVITKVENEEFKVHLTWLEGYVNSEEEKHWFDEGLSFGCGTFVASPYTTVIDSPEAFSHDMSSSCVPLSNSGCFISPEVEEIWAVYKNWRYEWVRSDLKKSAFELVKVLELKQMNFIVSEMKKVKGLTAVFEKTGEEREISFRERLRFSHKIPAFNVGEYFMELDTAAIPEEILRCRE